MEEKKEEQNPHLKGVSGIQNMGNTCYCNATLQMLRSVPEWTAYCLGTPFDTILSHLSNETPSKKIMIAYQDVLKSIWSAYYPAYVRPIGFLSEVKQAVQNTPYEMFGMPVQNDSHEYLVYLLDQFHEALKKQVPFEPCVLAPHASPTDRMRCLAENGWNRFYSKNQSEIVRLFFGMIRKTIECTVCHTPSYQWEVFNTLKIPCEGQTFYDWIRKEVNEEFTLDEYQCDHCHKKQQAVIQSHLWRMPSHLFITLRRFHHDGTKNMIHCPYDGSPLSFEPFYAKESDDPYRQRMYEVRSVVDHHGMHSGGHYTAQYCHLLTNQWWWVDDIQSAGIPSLRASSSNYLFYFRRV
jgi:ubiquitin C-terminal hydrolase